MLLCLASRSLLDMATPDHACPPVTGDDESSRDHSESSSANPSRESSRPPRSKHRVRFTPGGESLDEDNQRAVFDVRDDVTSPPRPRPKPRPLPVEDPSHRRTSSSGSLPRPALSKRTSEGNAESQDNFSSSPILRSSLNRPSSTSSSLTGSSDHSDPSDQEDDEETAGFKAHSQQSAQERAERLSRMIGSHSAPGSRTASPFRSGSPLRSLEVVQSPPSSPPVEANAPRLDLENIPLQKLHTRRTYGIEDEIEDVEKKNDQNPSSTPLARFREAAKRLVRHNNDNTAKRKREETNVSKVSAPPTPLYSGQITPTAEKDVEHYVERPKAYREGFLSSVLKLYNEQGLGSALSNHPVGDIAPPSVSGSGHNSKGVEPVITSESRDSSPPRSGTTTPRQKPPKWYYKNQQATSTGSIANLVSLATQSATSVSPAAGAQSQNKRPRPLMTPRSFSALDNVLGRKKQPKEDQSVHIQIHIAETMSRQAYLMKMCRALMNYGAPTHRLEEQMRMSARVLEIEGQFLYIPGCMIISFDDSRTHTTEVKIVRTQQAIDLGKLREVHDIYKETLHDMISVDVAMDRLDACTRRPQRYPNWMLVPVYGLASACVGPFAFGARPIDLPIAFFLGCCLGFMQLILAPKSELYSNIFEVTAAVFTSFLARAFGSIRGGQVFCFSALAQSAIALILPGYTVRK